MKVYITEMLRWGDDESHHYIVGVYTTQKYAILSGDSEKSWRGGKYEYRIVELTIDKPIPADILEYHRKCVIPERLK